jgi:hypothetical protein
MPELTKISPDSPDFQKNANGLFPAIANASILTASAGGSSQNAASVSGRRRQKGINDKPKSAILV